MDLGIKTKTVVGDDRNWQATQDGDDQMRSITLDGSAFTGTYADGRLPSGIPLGKITATGLYAPHNNSASDGTEVCAGLLGRSVPVINSVGATDDVGGALYWKGAVVESKLPAAWAALTATPIAAAKVDLAFIKFFA